MPAITVLLPVWNGEATLASALDSLVEQTFSDFELLVIDDGSTDASPAIAAACAARDARVRVLTLPHGGIVAALNAGLAAASAPLIARMDADDQSAPTRLARQFERLQADPELGLVSCLVAHGADPERDTTGYAYYVDWINQHVTPEAIARVRFAESPLAHPSVMFRRELVERHGGYREGNFPEDYELWLRWLEAGVQMAKVPETLLVWNDRPDRLSRTAPACGLEAIYELKTAYLARHLAAVNPAHPEIVIWGAGKTSRKRAALLEAHGVRIKAYIDIDPKREGKTVRGMPIHMPSAITDPSFGFVVSYVGKRGAWSTIQPPLIARGYVEGEHFLMAA